MIDWDDVRDFLAVAREGSVRTALQHGLGMATLPCFVGDG